MSPVFRFDFVALFASRIAVVRSHFSVYRESVVAHEDPRNTGSTNHNGRAPKNPAWH